MKPPVVVVVVVLVVAKDGRTMVEDKLRKTGSPTRMGWSKEAELEAGDVRIKAESVRCDACTGGEGGAAGKRTSSRAEEVDGRDGPTTRSTVRKVRVLVGGGFAGHSGDVVEGFKER